MYKVYYYNKYSELDNGYVEADDELEARFEAIRLYGPRISRITKVVEHEKNTKDNGKTRFAGSPNKKGL
jgi:hypothetical protein